MFTCPQCGRRTWHVVHASVDTDDCDESGDVQFWDHYLTVQCNGCKTISFCHESANSEEHEFDGQGRSHPIKHQKQYPSLTPDMALEHFVSPTRIEELSALRPEFDLTRLLQMLTELNRAYAAYSYLSCSVLVRAILDHVPPLFGFEKFDEVANNYAGGGKSFRESVQHLHKSSRKIADSALHQPIRRKESVPGKIQVEFRPDLDVLLGEIARVLRQPNAR